MSKNMYEFRYRVNEKGIVSVSQPPNNPQALADMVARIVAFAQGWYLGEMAKGNMVEIMHDGKGTGMYVYEPEGVKEAPRIISPARVPIVGHDGKRVN